MSNLVIRRSLETILQNWAQEQNPVLQIAYENRIQDSINNYLECFLIPSNNFTESLDGAHNCYSGIFQIVVNWRKGFGYGDAGSVVESIAGLFFCDRQIIADGLMIIIDSPTTIGISITTDRNYCVPIIVNYRLVS